MTMDVFNSVLLTLLIILVLWAETKIEDIISKEAKYLEKDIDELYKDMYKVKNKIVKGGQTK